MTKTFGRVFRLQVLFILLSNLLFGIIFTSFAFRLYKKALISSTDQAADNVVYLVRNRDQVEDFMAAGNIPGFDLKRFFPQIQTIRIYNRQGELLYNIGDKNLDKTGFPRRLFDFSVRNFRSPVSDELMIMEVYPVIRPGGSDGEPSYWIWGNVKRTGWILLLEMIAALMIAFFISRHQSLDSKNLSVSILRLANGHWEEEIPDGRTEESKKVAEAARILQYRLIRQRKIILRRLQELTHDLKSPLSGVYTQLEAIELGSLPLTEERFNRIYGELKYLNGLVDNMAECYRLEDEALPVNIKTIDTDEFLSTLKTRFEPLARKGKKELVFISEHESLKGDSDLLYRGVGNLLSNAIDHGQGRSITLSIRTGDKNQLLIEVENEGEIPEQDLASIMSRYWSHREKGRGLGLTIAELITQKHKGSLSVRNTGRGSVLFTMALPLS